MRGVPKIKGSYRGGVGGLHLVGGGLGSELVRDLGGTVTYTGRVWEEKQAPGMFFGDINVGNP